MWVAYVNFGEPMSGMGDSNPQPHAPEACALANCANPRILGQYFITGRLALANCLPADAKASAFAGGRQSPFWLSIAKLISIAMMHKVP